MFILTDHLSPAHPTAPCPSWCALAPVHAPDHADPADGSVTTIHRATVLADAGPAGRRIEITQPVTVHPDGRREVDEPAVMLDSRVDELLSAEQARRQAAALTLAAELIERSTANGGAR